MSYYAIMAVGLTIVIITGKIDISDAQNLLQLMKTLRYLGMTMTYVSLRMWRISSACTAHTASSAMLVAWSPTRSRKREIKIKFR